ncbi:hypothetical protein LX36DRAFT_182124 [Colletotrichum falcatum]|nr:hypothetical protein LX36DRAFT_182124 [Colletotrichum falcatum]
MVRVRVWIHILANGNPPASGELVGIKGGEGKGREEGGKNGMYGYITLGIRNVHRASVYYYVCVGTDSRQQSSPPQSARIVSNDHSQSTHTHTHTQPPIPSSPTAISSIPCLQRLSRWARCRGAKICISDTLIRIHTTIPSRSRNETPVPKPVNQFSNNSLARVQEVLASSSSSPASLASGREKDKYGVLRTLARY